MSTVSTKSRDRKTATDRNAAPVSSVAGTDKVDVLEISPRIWRLSSLTILLGAAFIRLYQLGLVPMHHDEGVNGFFLTSLYRTGVYHYDPTNYHGPTLYYFALVVTKLNALLFGSTAGLNTIAVRLVPAIFGIGTVWLALCLRRNIGTIGALAAAAFIALSPGDVYISRYFIHETHFVFFTLGIVVAALRYYESADPLYLLLASTSAALLFATKETATVNVAVIGLALAVAAVYRRLFKREETVPWEKKGGKQRKAQKRKAAQQAKRELLARFGGVSNVAFWSSIAFALFVFINILFYSSFFTYGQGVSGALESLQVWVKTGTNDPSHVHPLSTYLIWLWQVQAPLLLLGAVGALIALIHRRNRFTIFAGAWAFGIIAAYSLIPYKTPWLMINFTVPLAIIGGYAINEIYNFEDGLRSRILALTLALVALGVSGTQSVILNFYHYDDDQYPYVYAHSYRDLLSMVNEIERLAKRAGTEMKTPITITASEYWPLPWYLRDYEHAGFFGKMTTTDEPIVVGRDTQEFLPFRVDDFIDAVSLLDKLKDEQDPLSRYLRSKLSRTTVESIMQYTPRTQPREELVTNLVNDFNRLLEDPLLYEPEPFAQVLLRAETKKLMEQNPQGEELISLNRMLLEDAYPNEITKNLRLMLGDRYQRLNSYRLRPGVTLVLYAKKELAAP